MSEITDLEIRGMQSFGNIMALEAVVSCLVATHPHRDVLKLAFDRMFPALDSFMQKEILMTDDLSPQARVCMEQIRKMREKFYRIVESK